MEGAGVLGLATELAVNGTQETTERGWPLVRVDAEKQIRASWKLGGVLNVKQIMWRAELVNASSGEVIGSVDTGSNSAQFAALGEVENALLRVRLKNSPRGLYEWPPPNYTAVTGESETPSAYRWEHPDLGELFYDPVWRVGARPYNSDDPVQAALLELESAAIQSNEVRKNPYWVTYFIEFDSDGQQTAADGEWSLLRIAAGDSTWNESTHVDATFGALWRAPLDRATLTPAGAFTRWNIDASLRSVGALEVDETTGTLIIGGACASTYGPIPALFQIQQPSDTPNDESAGELSLAIFICECALNLGKSIQGIAQTSYGLRAVSPCDNFTVDSTRPLNKRLIPAHPGGRNALSWANAFGEHYVFSTEGGDFATSDHVEFSTSFVIFESSSGLRTGAPLGKQLDSQLAVFAKKVYGIEDTNYLATDAAQFLCCSDNGETWQRVTSWGKALFDGGVVARTGSKKRGMALWAFGIYGSGNLMKPRALQLQGKNVTRHINCEYFIQRANSFEYSGETWCACVGLKCLLDGDGHSSFPRLQYLLLTRGNGVGDSTNPEVPTNAREAFEQMPEGTKISLTDLSSVAEDIRHEIIPVSAVAYIPDLRHDTLAQFQYEFEFPFALWCRVDAEAPLLLDAGDEVTEDVLEQLEGFDQRADFATDRFLAIEGKSRVEAVLLLAPNWKLHSKSLKVRA